MLKYATLLIVPRNRALPVPGTASFLFALINLGVYVWVTAIAI